ncbi:MAG: response regulator [Verrucomicrobiota bacterium]|jgi:DNA-binding NtrC family response regulator
MKANRNGNTAPSQADRPLILVVEDEEDTREFIKGALQTNGLACIAVASVAGATAALEKNTVALIVLDWGLDRSGAEVLQFSRELYPLMPVIVMSGQPFDVRTDAVVQQADAFLQKPFSATVLTSQVTQLIKRARSSNPEFLPQRSENILPLDEVKNIYIRHVVHLLNNNVSLAAKGLGIHRQTVSAVLKKDYDSPSELTHSSLARQVRS